MYAIVNFGRKELEQTGSGHFACIGGYNSRSEKALVMDTARFKYPPFWVDVDQLYRSVCTTDKATGNNRGFLVLSEHANIEPVESTLASCIPLRVNFLSDMSASQLDVLLGLLASDQVKVKIFTFMHEL